MSGCTAIIRRAAPSPTAITNCMFNAATHIRGNLPVRYQFRSRFPSFFLLRFVGVDCGPPCRRMPIVRANGRRLIRHAAVEIVALRMATLTEYALHAPVEHVYSLLLRSLPPRFFYILQFWYDMMEKQRYFLNPLSAIWIFFGISEIYFQISIFIK